MGRRYGRYSKRQRKRDDAWRRQKTAEFPEHDNALGDCRECGKKTFATRQAAERTARRLFPGVQMRVYRCGQWWHLSSQDAATAERERSRWAVRPDEGLPPGSDRA